MPLKLEDRLSRLVVLELGLDHLDQLHRPLRRHKIHRTPLLHLGVYQGEVSRMQTGRRSRSQQWAYFRDLLLLGQVRQDIHLVQVSVERVS